MLSRGILMDLLHDTPFIASYMFRSTYMFKPTFELSGTCLFVFIYHGCSQLAFNLNYILFILEVSC
jgi:hypothetical protein